MFGQSAVRLISYDASDYGTPRSRTAAFELLLAPGAPVSRAVGLLAGWLGGCVYRLDVQQGNLLDQTDIEAIQPGMTRSQVRYLLGTPVAVDPFRTDRWDYMYYLKPGKSRKADPALGHRLVRRGCGAGRWTGTCPIGAPG